MPVVMSHLIGTVALIFFAATLTVYMSMITNDAKSVVVNSNLQSISDTVALYASKAIAMANMSNTGDPFEIRLNLPLTVSSSGYWIALKSTDGQYFVYSSSIVQPITQASSIIPINSIYSNIQIVLSGMQIVNLQVKDKLYGGIPNSVIWAVRTGNTISIGLGVMTLTGPYSQALSISIAANSSGCGPNYASTTAIIRGTGTITANFLTTASYG